MQVEETYVVLLGLFDYPGASGAVFGFNQTKKRRQGFLRSDGANGGFNLGNALCFHGSRLPLLLQPTAKGTPPVLGLRGSPGSEKDQGNHRKGESQGGGHVALGHFDVEWLGLGFVFEGVAGYGNESLCAFLRRLINYFYCET